MLPILCSSAKFFCYLSTVSVPQYESRTKYYPESPNLNQIQHISSTEFSKRIHNEERDESKIPRFSYTKHINLERYFGKFFSFEVSLWYLTSQLLKTKQRISLKLEQRLSKRIYTK
ncbi:hypothetical protein PanWU01x14_319330 [Parasponia andersonii]|uniref:Uncharacterized protein n=1 Tax=Parasponia andersonii TaxID=3476 RepID=A0A2P5AM86_PARAD|nr:hypothetical protein PanWU01x14_319330 [Parasponia andersonii]